MLSLPRRADTKWDCVEPFAKFLSSWCSSCLLLPPQLTNLRQPRIFTVFFVTFLLSLLYSARVCWPCVEVHFSTRLVLVRPTHTKFRLFLRRFGNPCSAQVEGKLLASVPVSLASAPLWGTFVCRHEHWRTHTLTDGRVDRSEKRWRSGKVEKIFTSQIRLRSSWGFAFCNWLTFGFHFTVELLRCPKWFF